MLGSLEYSKWYRYEALKNKAFPHPVLRNGGTDYLGSEFFTELSVERIEGTTQLRVLADFTLNDPMLTDLIRQKIASYVILIKCPETYLRKEKVSFEPKIECIFENGQIVGGIEITCFIVSVNAISNFSTKHWHSDYQGLSFDVRPGTVLAIHETKDFWIDTVDEEDIGSIINLEADVRVERGYWSCDLHHDRIKVCVASDDYPEICDIREKLSGTDDAIYLLNGFFLPVLIYVLMEADNDLGEYKGYRWFTALNNKLDSIKTAKLGDNSSDRATDAQKIFRSSFGTMVAVMKGEAHDSN